MDRPAVTAQSAFLVASQRSPVHTLWIAVGPTRIRIDVAGPRLAPVLLAPLTRRRTDPSPTAPDLWIKAWSVAETGVPPPAADGHWVTGEDPTVRITWFHGVDELTRGDLARPFERILLDGLRHHHLRGLHAAVVISDTAAAGLLLVGANGSGKSTTTLAALAAGMAMLGDDCVLFGDDGTAYSLYGTCCVTARSQTLLGLSPERIRRPVGAEPDAKGVLLTDPGQTAAMAQIAAIVFPRVVADAETSQVVPIGETEAMRRLMPAMRTARNLPAADRPAHFRAVVDFTAPLPKFRLDLGRDPGQIAAALRAVSDRLAP